MTTATPLDPSAPPRRVLLVGASGVFGARLAALLATLPDLEIVLCTRRPEPLATLRADLQALHPLARIDTATFDRDRPSTLTSLRPWLVVDAAGPFQAFGYGLALATVEAGAHYVDLADARAFVAGFAAAVGPAAAAAGVLAVTGASSTPALSHAALDTLVAGWQRIDSIEIAISPGARAPRGLSVMQAILGYAGQPMRVFRGGRWGLEAGWSDLRRIDMPRLGHRWASICETPDLDLLPERFAIGRDALFRAGLELAPMHIGLTALSALVRWRIVPTLRPLARPLRGVAGLLAPLGTDRGGMIVQAEGLDAEGRRIRTRWALWAEANAGPSTPAAPAAGLIRALAEDRETRRGAMACAGVLPLNAILRELATLPISSRTDEGYPDDPILFRRLLGARFERLPAAVQAVHGGGAATFTGRALTRAGRGLAARILRRALDLPPSGPTRVEVTFVPDTVGETWTRAFGEARFRSRLVDTGRLGVFEERIGPLRFAFDLQADLGGVSWHMIGWSILAMPLPLRFAPRMHARGEAAGADYRFRVVVAHPWTGLLFAYRGRLMPPPLRDSTKG